MSAECGLCEGSGLVPSASGLTDVECLHAITFTDNHRNVVTWDIAAGTLTEARRGHLVDDVHHAADLRLGGTPTFFHGNGGSWSFSPVVSIA